ncbi:MAG: ribosome maturation factor RimM [Candidatus Baltobacteraceae bacterium]
MIFWIWTNTKTTTKPNPEKKPIKPTQQSDRYAGRIVGIFGLKGELKCDPTSAGRTVFSAGATLRCEIENISTNVTIESIREHQGRPLIRLTGVSDADAAEPYKAAKFYAPRAAFVLDEGEYLDEDLIGCTLIDSWGKHVGTVAGLEHYPAQDMLVSGSARIPMVSAFIKVIDVDKKEIHVDLPLGLLDPAHAEEA